MYTGCSKIWQHSWTRHQYHI